MIMNRPRLLAIAIAFVLLISLSIFAQSGGSFTITKSVIAGGGDRSAGGTFVLDATIGQAITGTSTGGTFVLSSGFFASGETLSPVGTMFDFDGDGRADVSVFRPSSGVWHLLRSQLGYVGMAFGQNGDLLTPADFDGDGITDVAVFRPSNGTWYRLNSRREYSTSSSLVQMETYLYPPILTATVKQIWPCSVPRSVRSIGKAAATVR